MLRGDLSAEVAPTVAIDFDAVAHAPEPDWKQAAYRRLGRWPRLQHSLNWWYVPWLIGRHQLTRESETFGWWLLDKGLNVRIIVRRPYAPRLSAAVEKVMGDYPYEQGHVIIASALPDQAAEIHQYCRGNRVLRFFTRDKVLASHLPTSLVRWVDQWNDGILR
jgi:hypothetical protein